MIGADTFPGVRGFEAARGVRDLRPCQCNKSDSCLCIEDYWREKGVMDVWTEKTSEGSIRGRGSVLKVQLR